MTGDQNPGQDSEGAGHTHLGRRRADPASPPTDDAGATRLGRRATSVAPPADTGSTQLGRRRRADDTPPASAGTELGQRRATADEATPAGGTQLGQRSRTVEDSTAPAADGTQLGRRRQGPADTGLGQRARGGAAADPPATEQPVPPVADDKGITRFGPGVPRTPASSPDWSRPTVPATAKASRKRRRPWIGALVTLALVAGVLAWLLTHAGPPITAHAQQVTADSPPGACNTTVDVIGTITTNGHPGSITYQWIRNDGQPTDVLTQTVASGTTSTQVHLQWTFAGHGRFHAVATLRVIDPPPGSDAVGDFTYSCP